MRSVLIRVVAGLAILYLLLVLGLAWAMRQPPEVFGRVMSKAPAPAYIILPFETLWTWARAGQLRPGDPAPDFNLQAKDKDRRVQLSSFRGSKPVVLVFGSYT